MRQPSVAALVRGIQRLDVIEALREIRPADNRERWRDDQLLKNVRLLAVERDVLRATEVAPLAHRTRLVLAKIAVRDPEPRLADRVLVDAQPLDPRDVRIEREPHFSHLLGREHPGFGVAASELCRAGVSGH